MRSAYEASWIFLQSRYPDTYGIFKCNERPFGLFTSLTRLEAMIRQEAMWVSRGDFRGPESEPGNPFAWYVRERALFAGSDLPDRAWPLCAETKVIRSYDSTGELNGLATIGPFTGWTPGSNQFVRGDFVHVRNGSTVSTGLVQALPMDKETWLFKKEEWLSNKKAETEEYDIRMQEDGVDDDDDFLIDDDSDSFSVSEQDHGMFLILGFRPSEQGVRFESFWVHPMDVFPLFQPLRVDFADLFRAERAKYQADLASSRFSNP